MAGTGVTRTRRVAILLVAGAAATSCADRPDRPDRPDEIGSIVACESSGTPAVAVASADSIVVRGSDAPCTIEFREVTRLKGEMDGISPRVPIAVGPGGTFLSGTYEKGQVAIWSPEGDLERLLGNGSGSGPGEFGWARGLAVGPDSVVNIMTGYAHWHRYTLSGEFLETVRIPAVSGTSEVTVASDGTVVTTVRGADRTLFTLHRDSLRNVGPYPTGGLRHSISLYAPNSGPPVVRSVEAPFYVVRRHALPSGDVNLRIRREVAWYREPETPLEMAAGNLDFSTLYELAVDRRAGLVWTLHSVPAPDAPDEPPPPVRSQEEARRVTDRYRDNLIEVISLDGRLIANRWYRDTSSMPLPVPMTSRLWYVVNDDLLRSVTILTPELVEGG